MNPYIIRALMIAGCAATLTPIGICQQPAAKVIGDIQPAHPVTSRVPVDMLAQLSGSLQQLASKVSPAVVQIEVTGIGQTELPGG